MDFQYSAFRAAFEISPIVLTNGIAKYLPLGTLPIVLITEPVNTAAILARGLDPSDLGNFLAHFEPASGAQIISNEVGTYPFANQDVAANAIIRQPLNVSMIMKVPTKSYPAKFISFLALRKILDKHNSSGGTYTVLTPTALYTNCLMTGLMDVSSGKSRQPQVEWQFDFMQPLLTLGAAQQSYNNLMGKLSNNTQVTGTKWTGSPVPSAPGL